MSNIENIANILKDKRLDAVLISSLVNVRYLTGFTGSSAVLLITARAKSYLITDFRYIEQAREQVVNSEIIILEESFQKEISALIGRNSLSSIAFEPDNLTFARYTEFSDKLGIKFEPLKNVVENLRAIKTAQEIEYIRKACDITTGAMRLAIDKLTVPGMTEKEAAFEIECYMRKNGAEDVAFAPIVASGPNSAKPHAVVSDRKIRPGDFVVVDIGAKYRGYCADMTRTFCLGKATSFQKEVYEIVKQAQEAVYSGGIIGRSGIEADACARDIIAGSGHGKNFGHGLGHGVGLEAHEQPTLSPRSPNILSDNMVFTNEPGIYIAGQFGVRIEDTMAVKGKALISLTDFPRDLLEL